MKVLFAIDSVGEDAGTEKHVLELARLLDRTAVELHVCCLQDSPQLRALAAHCATRVFPVTSMYTLRAMREVRRLRRYIDDNHIDVVHTFLIKAAIFALLGARGSRARAVVTSRRNAGYWYTPYYRRVFHYLNRYATRVLANSERVKQVVVEAEGVAPEKVDVLYNGVDMDRYAPGAGDPRALDSLGVPRNARVVGIVANYRPVKGLELFVRAAARVAAEVPDAAFLLVGRGPLERDLVTLAAELGIAGRVFFTRGQADVCDCLARTSVACLSSESEGFSNAILEYMAAGLPVVATDVGGNAEAIQDGVTGRLVRSRDPEAFAGPVIELLQNESLRCAMARASLDRCRREFEIRTSIRKLEQYYAALAGDLSPAPAPGRR